MNTHQKQHREHYYRTREAFDDLETTDKAVFLIEATVATIAKGLEEAGQTLAAELDHLFRMKPGTAHEETPRKDAPGPAEPETAAQQASRSRTKKKEPGSSTHGSDTEL